MKRGVREAADGVLRGVVEQEDGVPGVVAMATDREVISTRARKANASLAGSRR